MRKQNILLENSIISGNGLVVDRDAGIIRNVKILGYKSNNNRYYPPSTMKEAVAQNLYEQVPVFANHLLNNDDQRKIEDRLGRIINVRYVEGSGLMGDFELLKSHPMSERIFEAAERLADSFGFSHTAEGEVKKNKNGIFEITKLTKVLSVDLVATPATVSSLAEGSIMKKVEKDILEGVSPYESEKEIDMDDKKKKEMDDKEKEPSDKDEKKENMDMDMKKDDKDMKKEEDDDKDMEEKDDDDDDMKKEEEKDDDKKKESVKNVVSRELILEYCHAANIKPDVDLVEDLSEMNKDLAIKTIRRLAEAKLENVKTYGPRGPEKKETNIKDIANWLLN